MNPDPSDPRALLQRLEQRARRRFGQHFLWRRDVVDTIVRAADVGEGTRVVEIGPGLGILTQALVAAGAAVTAIELDRDLAEYVRAYMPSVTLIETDAARVDWPSLLPGAGWAMVSNLPYNVGTGVVADALRHPGTFSSITVMLQREVVERMLAEPGSKAYGALSVHVRARAEGRFVTRVPPGAFHPPPKVDSSVIRLDVRPVPDVGPAGEAAFERVVRAAFAQRRKTVLNSLGTGYPKERAAAALAAAGVEPSRRAETLTLQDFQRVAAALEPPTG